MTLDGTRIAVFAEERRDRPPTLPAPMASGLDRSGAGRDRGRA